jgi:uncharacterized protein (TIGR02145 family)
MKKCFFLFYIAIVLFPFNIHSQISDPIISHKKVALVIGNGNYLTSILANPENDARSMTQVLSKLGFIVSEYENLDYSHMLKAIDDFGAKLKGNDIGLFFYAGHGIQSSGYNYLIPVDARLTTEKQVEYDCVRADRILALMEGSGTKVNILILDACRDNPFERSWTRSASGKGLAFMTAPKGTLIAYATAPGSTASDGSGNNGLYTSAILESIKIPNITILQMFQQVRSIVNQKSNEKQTPWESTSLIGDFYFNDGKVFIDEEKVLSNQQKSSINNSQPIDNITTDEANYIVDARDNQRYKTVKIGNQTWMAENLKCTIFIDGTAIQLTEDKKVWSDLKTPAYCLYNNETSSKSEYGALYNWYAVNSGKLCPEGWHIPSNAEWMTLSNFLGGRLVAGEKLKEASTNHWTSYKNIKSSGNISFNALPGGYRSYNGTFNVIGLYGDWWSTNENSVENSNYNSISYNNDHLDIFTGSKRSGFSVRCLKND